MPFRVFKDIEFHRWAKGITDVQLCAAANEIESGLVNARLGGFLIKKRIGAFGRGKRGGFRTIAAHRQGERLIFLARARKITFLREKKKRFVSWVTNIWRTATPNCPSWCERG